MFLCVCGLLQNKKHLCKFCHIQLVKPRCQQQSSHERFPCCDSPLSILAHGGSRNCTAREKCACTILWLQVTEEHRDLRPTQQRVAEGKDLPHVAETGRKVNLRGSCCCTLLIISHLRFIVTRNFNTVVPATTIEFFDVLQQWQTSLRMNDLFVFLTFNLCNVV